MSLTRPGVTAVRWLSMAALVLNIALVVSGGAVRLTDSGLGCPTWPRCTPGSLVVTPALGVHGDIEFGNRLIGVALEVVGVLLVGAVFLLRPKAPTQWRWLALTQVLVVPAQAVIGGILVLTHLNPYVRILHFLVSFPIMLAAIVLTRHVYDGPRPRTSLVARPVRALTGGLLGTAAIVLVLGAVVSGTGPHAGDPSAARLPFDPELTTQAHADAVYLLLGLTLAAAVATHAVPAPARVRQAMYWLLAGIVAQGVLGYVQYFTGAPPVLVGLHMLGASLVFLAAAWTHYSTRGPIPATEPIATAHESAASRFPPRLDRR